MKIVGNHVEKIGTLYLAHGYDPLTKPFGLALQAKLEARGIEIINPFQRGEQAIYDKYIADGVDFPPEVCEQIVNMDLDKIDISDGIVAVPSTTSIGTFMEIFYASYLYQKPVWTLWLHGTPLGKLNGNTVGVRRHPWLDHLTKLYVGADKEQEVLDAITLHFAEERGTAPGFQGVPKAA